MSHRERLKPAFDRTAGEWVGMLRKEAREALSVYDIAALSDALLEEACELADRVERDRRAPTAKADQSD